MPIPIVKFLETSVFSKIMKLSTNEKMLCFAVATKRNVLMTFKVQKIRSNNE